MDEPELNPIDRHFATLLHRIAQPPSEELKIAAQLVSRLRADGHVCVSLRETTAETLAGAGIDEPLPAAQEWIDKLRGCNVVGQEGDFTPLILDKADRLYLHRYWHYEDELSRNLAARLQSKPSIDESKLSQELPHLFSQEAELQKLAAFVAATSNLCVISGAPGTGKTHTVVMICALLIAMGNEPQIALAAPTGKAAARLRESLAQAKAKLVLPEAIRAALPSDASTIQRLLGVLGDTGKFRHDAKNPLNADVVILDEASMIDLALLTKLLAAVRSNARVILVGDKDQLASVEAGSAFRDICTPGTEIGISANLASAFRKRIGGKLSGTMPRRAPIHDVIVELRKNFRFAEGEGIAELSTAINRGDAKTALAVLAKGGQVSRKTTPNVKTFQRALQKRIAPHIEKILHETDPAEGLNQLAQFSVLCALRRGPFGVVAVNKLIEATLRESGAIAATAQYYRGQPLMILRNDYNVDLFNGDLGMILDVEGEQRAFFRGQGGELRSFSPARLPAHETAFALTVHKSQGSEFQECLVILPDRASPVLTRELLYTAVTRVRQRVEVWGSEGVLSETISRQVRRSSGLRDALWHRGC